MKKLTAEDFKKCIQEEGRDAFMLIEDGYNMFLWDHLNKSFQKKYNINSDSFDYERVVDEYRDRESAYYRKDRQELDYVRETAVRINRELLKKWRKGDEPRMEVVDTRIYNLFKEHSEKVEPLQMRMEEALNKTFLKLRDGTISRRDYEFLAQEYNMVLQKAQEIMAEYGMEREEIDERLKKLNLFFHGAEYDEISREQKDGKILPFPEHKRKK